MFAELLARTCFSFLDGGSQPAEVVARACALSLSAVAIVDRNGLYGVARAYAEHRRLAREGAAHARLIVGAELDVDGGHTVALLAESAEGWATLSRHVTAAHAGRDKGTARFDPARLAADHRGLIALLPSPYDEALTSTVRDALGDRVCLAVHRHKVSDDGARGAEAEALSARLGVPIVATGRPLYHARERRRLHDVLTCIRLGVTLDEAGTRVSPNDEAFLRGDDEMRRVFRDRLAWVDRAGDLARACTFSLSELRYHFPSDDACLPGESPDDALRRLCAHHLPYRYPEGAPSAVLAQIDKELSLIARLGVAPYFLSVKQIVDLARERGILCQGRGSAANSAVCFMLGVTSVDPARSSLLFERFLSAERAEPPDIDVDFEHERREEVIQEIYRRYGRDRAAMVSEVIRYRERSALRDVGRVFGLSDDVTSRMSSGLLWGESIEVDVTPRLAEVGLDAADPRLRQVISLAAELQGFPRHLSVHVGGFVLSSTSLVDVAPIEPAAMPGRTVVQWDKDDVDVLGFFKVDVLALGMLTAIQKALALAHEGPAPFDPIAALARVPPEDPRVYDALCRADSVGVFQVESRAQMAMLPQLRPRRFYDLVIQVAIVRPGPIQGGMVHPFLRRRRGEEPPDSPHPRLAPILDRTLGIPLFQEQVMQLAIVGAGYTGGEADELRRDMAAWKRSSALLGHQQKLLEGFRASGISDEFAARLFEQIKGFGEYGFPESHSASFALLVYASAWLKVHEPAAFVCALLNSQPMGFYSASALVQDAQRHGIEARPVCAQRSLWDCTLEADASRSRPAHGRPQRALRLGLRQVRGLSRAAAERLVAARPAAGFADLDELLRQARLGRRDLDLLAEAGAFAALTPSRRDAMWRARRPDDGALFRALPSREPAPRLPALTPREQLTLDYERVGLSIDDHPMRHLRAALAAPRLVTHRALSTLPHKSLVSVAGLVQSRQRPVTARGVVFVTLEDETGSCNIVLWDRVFERYRLAVTASQALLVRGVLEREGETVHVIAERVARIDGEEDLRIVTRDFH
ncbi:MAG: error-prone DNA polymerase [Polyangiaceae bacterium]|nr:error-prone DNA polymerase [Polyangiaceae bacterium]